MFISQTHQTHYCVYHLCHLCCLVPQHLIPIHIDHHCYDFIIASEAVNPFKTEAVII